MELDIKQFAPSLKGYAELRLHSNTQLNISLVKGNLVSNARAVTSGVSTRAFHKGAWGLASSPELTKEKVEQVITDATKNAQFLGEKVNKPFELPDRVGVFEKSFATEKSRWSQKEMIDFAKSVDEYIASKYPDLLSRNVTISNLDIEKRLLTSTGGDNYSMVPRALIAVSMSAESSDGPVETRDIFGGRGQFEDLFDQPDKLHSKLDEIYVHLQKKKEGVYASGGMKEVVMDSELAGILAHEAIGHTVEADLVLGGSVAGDNLNKMVASEKVTLIDYAHTADGATCPVPVYVDDEGVKAEDAVIIEDGVLKTFMHNKESAQHFDVAPTGNARAWSFSDEPLIRMRNTAIRPGTDKLDDMIASVDDGYYLMRPGNGQADSTSEFMFGVTLGYEIKNGKLGKAIKDTTISGVAFDMLKTIDMISDDMTWSCAGMCGKKQIIPVGMGGPAIKAKVNLGGR